MLIKLLLARSYQQTIQEHAKKAQVNIITGSFWTVRDGCAWSKYGNLPYRFSQSCEKLTDAIKRCDISGTSELLIIHFKWYGNITQSAALLTCTHVHYTYYTPAVAEVALLKLLDMYIFLHCLLLEKDQ